MEFQSPPSVRKATYPGGDCCHDLAISIPAFREEGDMVSCASFSTCSNFNPRLP